MSEKYYIVAVDRKDGTEVYCRVPEGSSPAGYNYTTTPKPEMARKFEMDQHAEVIRWIDRIKSAVSRNFDSSTLRALVLEMNVRPISEDDSDWNKALRMNAISKLTEQEIVALGLQSHEIERRLSKD